MCQQHFRKVHMNLRVLLCAGLFTLFIGCAGSTGHKSDEKYYLVAANVKLPYWQSAAAGLSHAARQLDVKAETVGPENYDPHAEQAAFRDAVSKGAAGILVSPADPNLMKPDIDAAISHGIPVITIDSDAPASNRLFFIGTNNREVGLMGGQRVVKELNGKGNVVMYTLPGQENIEERLHGYKDVFEEHPGIKIIAMIDVKGDPTVAFDQTTNLLEKGKDKPDAFICLEAVACREVADVLDRKKTTGKVVIAMDTDQGTLDWIKKGTIGATIAQKPYTMAFYGLKALGDLHLNKLPSLDVKFAQQSASPVPVFVDTGIVMIDKSNVEAFASAQNEAKTEK
jgi:ribose transport system substrate-binding protein